MPGDPVTWIVVGLVTVLVVVFVVALLRARSGAYTPLSQRLRVGRRPTRDEIRGAGARPSPTRRAAVIVNPTKFVDTDVPRRRIAAACAIRGWGEPLWFETSLEVPTPRFVHEALAQGVQVVIAYGGDGTVRSVAEGLVGTGIPMGLLPGGTGNLLARNLGVPLDDLDAALETALTGENKPIDVGWLTVAPEAEGGEQLFLVMAGLGFDAAIMADAPAELKARVGPAAYLVSGLSNLTGASFKAQIRTDGEFAITRRTRTVVIGNCGRLLGGLVLMPEAKIDDGKLDVVTISPRGVIGWSAVAASVVTRSRKGHALVDHHSGAQIRVSTEHPQAYQLDGDVAGTTTSLLARVDPLALVVRVRGS